MSQAAKPNIEMFADFANTSPHEERLAFDEERLTWRELDLSSNRMARLLKANEIKVGDHVMIGLNQRTR